MRTWLCSYGHGSRIVVVPGSGRLPPCNNLGMPEPSPKLPEPIERQWPETFAADELTLQLEFLQFLRATAVNKIAGLSRELACATPISSSPLLSLAGVIKHLTAVERFWISRIAGGKDLPALWDDSDVDFDFRVSEDETPAELVSAYREEWRLSAQAISGMLPSDATRGHDGRKARTVRWVLSHLIQETARHVGHMDILRELADGQKGE